MAYDKTRGDQAVKFFPTYLRHTKGAFAGAQFKLQPWQADGIIRPLFGTVGRDGFRQYRFALVEVPRKNGKSEVAAGVALKLLAADSEPAAEVYGAASDRQQAAQVFDVAAAMVRMNRPLNARAKVTDSRKNISIPRTSSFYRVVSAEGSRQHGLNPSGVVFDEVHTQKNRALWHALTMGSDTRRQPLFFAITTAGVPNEAPLWWELTQYARQVREGIVKDPTFLSVFYGAELTDDFDDPRVWKSANPALGTFLSLEKFKANWARARKIPGEWSEFLRYRLNVPVQASSRWLPTGEWDACGRRVDWTSLRGEPCYLGLDLSSRRDVTAMVAVFPRPNGETWVREWFWVPEEAVSDTVRPWVPNFVSTTPGNAVDYDFVVAAAMEAAREFQVRGIAFDRFNEQLIANLLSPSGIPQMVIPWGARTINGPMKEAEALIAERRMVHDGNPVMRWMVDCVAPKYDANGNVMPVKPDRMKSMARIDGVSAMLMGLLQSMGDSSPMGGLL